LIDLIAEFLSWEAKRVVEAKVLMSRIIEVTIPLPTVLVRVSIVDMAAAALASVRAVIMTEEAPRLTKWIWHLLVENRDKTAGEREVQLMFGVVGERGEVFGDISRLILNFL